jgi:S-(hydroxymethyl)glutathione dehydrogenase/alcohol dehydrogenase
MPEILRLAERGTFRLETFVTRRYSLDESEAAYQALSRGEIAGRAVVLP